MGVARWLLQDPDRTIPAARKAVRLAPNNGEHRYRLGAMLYEMGHPDEALAELAAAAKLSPQRSEV